MKNIYLTAAFLLLALGMSAQPTCDEPSVLIEDGIENYAVGDITMQSADWGVWPDAPAGGQVTTEEASDGSQSVKIDGSISGQDVLLLLGEYSEGHYITSWDMYVPGGSNAYFNLQQQMPTTAAGFWNFEAFFEDGQGRLELFDGTGPTAFNFPSDTWFTIYLLTDLDNDQARLIVNEKTVGSWQLSAGNTPGLTSINSINFWPSDASYVYYIDNVNFWEIPAPEMGQYCYTAEVVEEPGFFAVPDLSCYGAGYDLGGGAVGFAGYWYAYTPAEDGILSISSCGGGADTRGWIFSGVDCRSLQTVGVNDDRCDRGDGNDYASYREAVVTAGATYYFMWDDIWSASGFGFELALDTETEPEEGEFCQSAIAIEPGDYTIVEMTGEAAVAGPNINNTSASVTSYTQSKWYAYTPTASGYMSISSCELAASDTRFYVYTGDCSSFEGLTLVAENNNGCFDGEDLQVMAALDSIEVAGGTTYYIEWVDREIEQEGSEELFGWNLGFEAFAASTVTFQVDMQLEEVSPEGVFLAGSFSGANNIPMEDNDGDGIYAVDVLLDNNSNFTYKYKNGLDGEEQLDVLPGSDCTGGNFADRILETGEESLTLDPVCFGFCVSCIVDVDEAALRQGVEVFPNPVENRLNLRYDFQEVVGELNIRLMDVLGRTHIQQRLTNIQTGSHLLNVAELSAGAYILQLSADGVQHSRSVVVR